MIHQISKVIVKWLLSAGAISSNEQEIYEYAVYSVIFSVAPLFLVFVIGSFLDIALEGVIFLLPFLLIRKFSGGFHLKSPVVCFISSVTVLTVFYCSSENLFNSHLFLHLL